MWVWIWLGVVVVSLIIEFVTLEMVSIWFSISGLIALILALCNVPYYVQIPVFVALAAILLLSFRKIALKFLIGKNKERTNKDTLIGQTHKLIDGIDEDKAGSLKVNDIVWTAISNNGSIINAGELVRILELKGNKVVVEKIKEESQKENDDISDKKVKSKALKKEDKGEKA